MHVFDTQIKTDSKAYIFIFIPLYAFFNSLLFIKCKRYIVEHLIFSVHFVAFILCVFFLHIYLVTIPAYYFFLHRQYSADFDAFSGFTTQLIIGTYFAFAVRRFYKVGWLWALVTGFAVGYTFFDLVQLYRMLLFFKIMYF